MGFTTISALHFGQLKRSHPVQAKQLQHRRSISSLVAENPQFLQTIVFTAKSLR